MQEMCAPPPSASHTRAQIAVEDLFRHLLHQGWERVSGETLGKTAGLDLLGLYESAADTHFQEGHYGRALEYVHAETGDQRE